MCCRKSLSTHNLKGNQPTSLRVSINITNMSDDNTNDANVRRSKRIAAKDDKPNLMDNLLDELDIEDAVPPSTAAASSTKKLSGNLAKKKFYKSTMNNNKKEKEGNTGTLFDQGLKAVSILGATSVDDEAKGTNDICYLVKYDNDQFELVLNTIAHKFCPNLVINFLESRILFREKDDFELTQELFGDSSQLSHISEIEDNQISHIDHSTRSIEI